MHSVRVDVVATCRGREPLLLFRGNSKALGVVYVCEKWNYHYILSSFVILFVVPAHYNGVNVMVMVTQTNIMGA